MGKHVEMSPLCVLDFYVHESMQRRGVGLQLFEHMLEKETVQPRKLGYDRPSHKVSVEEVLLFRAQLHSLCYPLVS